MAKQPIILTDQIIPPPALVRAGLEMLPAAIAAHGERAGRRFIEFFTATIRNRNTRMAYARAVKRFFDWCEDHHLGLDDIEPIAIAAYIEELGTDIAKPSVKQHPRRDPPAVRLSGDWRHPAIHPGRLGARPQVRGHARQDAGALRRRDAPAAELNRYQRTDRPARPRPARADGLHLRPRQCSRHASGGGLFSAGSPVLA